MNYSNLDIRQHALANGIPMYKIAEALGMSETGFSRKMRYELSEDEKKRVFDAIDRVIIGRAKT